MGKMCLAWKLCELWKPCTERYRYWYNYASSDWCESRFVISAFVDQVRPKTSTIVYSIHWTSRASRVTGWVLVAPGWFSKTLGWSFKVPSLRGEPSWLQGCPPWFLPKVRLYGSGMSPQIGLPRQSERSIIHVEPAWSYLISHQGSGAGGESPHSSVSGWAFTALEWDYCS